MAITTITLHDEGTRRALQFALWHRASGDIGETFYDQLSLEARASITWTPDEDSEFAEVADEVQLLRATLNAVERVRIARLGERVELKMSAMELREGLAFCSAVIVEDEEFWLSSADAREKMLTTHDAAQRLLVELGQHAEAVA